MQLVRPPVIKIYSEDQYAGDGIAGKAESYGMATLRVDGNDALASYWATKKAREYIIETQSPVCIEFMTYRVDFLI